MTWAFCNIVEKHYSILVYDDVSIGFMLLIISFPPVSFSPAFSWRFNQIYLQFLLCWSKSFSFLASNNFFIYFSSLQGIRVFVRHIDKFSTDQNVLLHSVPFPENIESLLQCAFRPEIVAWANSTPWGAYTCVTNPACVIILLSLDMHWKGNPRAHKIFRQLPEIEFSTRPSSTVWTIATPSV